MRGREADFVLAAVGGAEGEAAARGAALRDDAVVVVEGFVDADEDTDVRIRGERVDCGVVLGGLVVA